MKRLPSSFAFLCSSLVFSGAGCLPNPEAASNPKYLIEGEYDCFTPKAERLASTQSRIPSGFVSGYSQDQMPIIHNRIALIPDRDMNYLFDNFKAGVLRGIAPSGGGIFGIAGVTSLSAGASPAGNSGLVAREIGTGPNQAGFALQHEIGHAVEILAADAAMNTAYKDFQAALGQLQSELEGRRDVRSYAKSAPAESWAEAYSNFYCSPESNDFLKSNLPFANTLLRAVLVPPVWEEVAGANPPPPEATPEVSGDGRRSDEGEQATSDTGETFGKFLDRIVSLLGGGDGQKSAQDAADSSHRAQEEVNSDITLALTEIDGTEESTALMLSTSKLIKQVALCIGTASDCASIKRSESRDSKYLFDEFKAGSRRNFFSLETIDAEHEKAFDGEWHISGYDAEGKLVAVRHVKIVPKERGGR